MVLIIDPQIAGISGDMLLSSLVHLGANKQKIIDGVKIAQTFLTNSKITKIDFIQLNKNGVNATKLVLELDEHIHERKGSDIQNCISKTVTELNLSKHACDFAISSIHSLVLAESKIHGTSTESVHFHEAASIDTVIDIVGVAIALDDLNLFEERIFCLPIAVGSGFVSFSHGKVSNPAGAILEIFKDSGAVIHGVEVHDELCTPTGSSMLVNLVSDYCTYYPSLQIISIGYGAGEKNFDNFSNVLKIVKGTSIKHLSHDFVTVLETNLDDVSGEVIGFLIERLIELGAKDVTVTTGITKKNRPTFLLSVICSPELSNLLVTEVFEQTGTLGIRIHESERIIKEREIKSQKIIINDKEFLIRYKESKIGVHLDMKIEFNNIQNVSRELHISLRESERLILQRLLGELHD